MHVLGTTEDLGMGNLFFFFIYFKHILRRSTCSGRITCISVSLSCFRIKFAGVELSKHYFIGLDCFVLIALEFLTSASISELRQPESSLEPLLKRAPRCKNGWKCFRWTWRWQFWLKPHPRWQCEAIVFGDANLLEDSSAWT